MTQPILPSGGGSYERLADGSLKVVEQPLATHDTTTDVVREVAAEPVEETVPQSKSARRAEMKEA